MSFKEEYSRIYDIVKSDTYRVIESILSFDFDISEPLKSKLKDFLSQPSKHIRALVSFLYLRAKGYEVTDKQILYQSAIELVHNASLLHDDVIDGDKIRRNSQTLNSIFSGKIAVIAGDYLLSHAIKCVLKIGLNDLNCIFCDTLKEMIKGEVSQYFSINLVPTLDKYLKKSEQKTAKLFDAALKGAMIIANSDDDGSDYALNFGLAFQIRDDLINCKTTQSDIKSGIYTAPVIFSGHPDNIDIENTEGLLNNYIDNAKRAVEHLEDTKYKRALTELAEILRYE